MAKIKKRKTKSQKRTATYTESDIKAQEKIITQSEKKLHSAIHKLHKDIIRKASKETLMKDHANILLIFGECNYLAKEWNSHKKWDRRLK